MAASHTQITESKENVLNYDSLFKYIRLNTDLKIRVAALESTCPPELEIFKKAAINGDLQAKIFSDPNCWLYPLVLIKTGELKFWHGITVYLDVIALAQFTDRQSFKVEDNEKCKLHDETKTIALTPLLEKGELSDDAKNYLNYFFEKSKVLNIASDQVTQEKFKAFLTTLSPREQALLRVPYHAKPLSEDEAKYYEGFRDVITSDVPWFCFSGDNTQLFIPSFSLLNWFSEKLAIDSPVTLLPAFGRVGTKTLEDLHSKGMHFLPLYSPFVKTNFLDAHNCAMPFYVSIHDAVHRTWMDLFPLSLREDIFRYVIPVIEKGCEALKEIKDSEELVQHFSYVARDIADFDLSGMMYILAQSTEKWFPHYLTNMLAPRLNVNSPRHEEYKENLENTPVGAMPEDHFYYFVNNIIAREPRWSRSREIFVEIRDIMRSSHGRPAVFFAEAEKLSLALIKKEPIVNLGVFKVEETVMPSNTAVPSPL